MIPFSEVTIGIEEREAVLRVLDSGRLTRGPVCEEFEDSLEAATGQWCHVVSSGTAALHLALLGVGVRPGDEVIVPATTFVATANAVLYCGATPVVVDVDPKSWTICDHWTACVTKKTKAVIPVHLYGNPAPSLRAWRDDYYQRTGRHIAIVEDAAESLGCRRSGIRPHGDATAYSFYGSKTITTGEGGAVSWNDGRIGRRIMHLAAQAQTERYQHDTLGFNYRMTELQAAIGIEQLKKLPQFLAARRLVFDTYLELLPRGFRPQTVHKDDTHSCWAFAVTQDLPKVNGRELVRRMHQLGVECRPIFPPVSSFPHVAKKGVIGGGVTASLLHDHGIVLPTHPHLRRSDIEKVCESLARCVA